jgi:predicted Zn-dependent peptidase
MIKQFEFPNGFRVIYEKPQNSLKLTSINVFCELGSVHETNKNRGVSHFIEHMCFKGTKKIPQTKDINAVYDNIGAYFNAFTDRQYTCYVLKCQDQFLTNSLLVLSDMLMNSKFSKTDFDREKKVVVEENILRSDDPVILLDDIVTSLIYNGSSYAFSVDTIHYHTPGSLDYGETLETYKKFYQPENLVFSIVSHMDFDDILTILKKSYFMRKSTAERLGKYSVKLSIQPQEGVQYQFTHKPEIHTMYLNIGFRTCSQYSPDKYTIMFLKHIIGGSMRSSRLYTLLRENNGLTYTTKASASFYENMGDIQIYAEFDPKKLMKNNSKLGVLPLIINMLNNLVKKGITEKELSVCKNNMKGNLLLNIENSGSQTLYNGEQVLLFNDTDLVPYHTFFDTFLKNITKEDVNQMIEKYLRKGNMSVCIISGENQATNKIKTICEKFIA